MNALILVVGGVFSVFAGAVLGYFARQSIARRQAGTLEQRLSQKAEVVAKESEALLAKARQQAKQIQEAAKAEEDARRKALLETEQVVLKRETALDHKLSVFEQKEKELSLKGERLLLEEGKVEGLKTKALQKLEEVGQLSQEQAKEELLSGVQARYEKDILGKMRKLEAEGQERFSARAKEIVAYAIQKTAVPQAQEITTTTVALPAEDMKGKIIGKEGRNIRALERVTGVEVIVDETPEAVVISGFDPLRRHIAKVALERLIKHGRIHPARVEEEVAKVQAEVEEQMREAGEAASFDLGIVGLDPKLVQLLGRVKFRTSYGQNVLLHSVEVAYLSPALAAEIGANVQVCKKAGLLHDIGKAVDQEVEGSHIEIGIKILEKFGEAKEIIQAMKA